MGASTSLDVSGRRPDGQHGPAIRAVVLDIDGVLTDGQIVLNETGGETKVLFLRDLDAITRAREEGLRLALVTGEDSALAEVVARRLGIETVLKGAEDKAAALKDACARLGITPAEACYVGDADRDAPALAQAGLGLAPADASRQARESAGLVLDAPGGRGAVAEALEVVRRLNSAPPAPTAARATDMWRDIGAALDESIRVKRAVLETLAGEISTAAAWMVETLRHGSKLLLLGNGGSAADAQHIAAELVGRFERDRGPLSALALTTDTSVLTALGNDYGVETIFARQVEALAQPGDLVVALSTSGNSPNVLRAVMAARAAGVRTVALTGAGGGRLALLVDLAVRVPSSRAARIQESHIAIGHALCEAVEAVLCGERRGA